MLLDFEDIIEKYNLKITGVIHVGAHHGQEHERYTKSGVERVAYFEPVHSVFEKLQENLKSFSDTSANCHVSTYNFALGNENRKVEMFVEKNDHYGCSSILKPSSNYDHIPFLKNQTVEMKRLDDVGLSGSFNFLNIDVQGYKLEVMKGASKTLESIDYVMCEINRITPRKKLDYDGASLIENVSNFLSSYGFTLVEENWAGVSWGDGFFIKSE